LHKRFIFPWVEPPSWAISAGAILRSKAATAPRVIPPMQCFASTVFADLS
jgi:hypothetical protein